MEFRWETVDLRMEVESAREKEKTSIYPRKT